jgi:NAD(P)H-hydrate epimerase
MANSETGSMNLNSLYLSHQVKQIDAIAMEKHKLTSYELMQKAGAAIYPFIKKYSHILIVTGAGNNAGDGFVIAKLALQNNIKVKLTSLVDIDKLPEDANQAAHDFLAAGGTILNSIKQKNYDCIVDAIFGTGLTRNVEGVFAEAIQWINQQQSSTILSVDIPSGLESNTGVIMNTAVNADVTVAVICLKPGYYTNSGKDCVGQLYLESLSIQHNDLDSVESKIQLLDKSILKQQLFKHPHNSHKGSFGNVVIAGGHQGMLGAVILAGKSALISGCGLVEVVTNNPQSVLMSLHCPELLTAANMSESRILYQADVIAAGPGLGIIKSSYDVLKQCLELNKPMVLDADALTLISMHEFILNKNCVITPHPKEAARLLNTSVSNIQSDRIKAAQQLSDKFNSVVILKGSGTIVTDTSGDIFINPFGYSGMASAGMGDVLTGMVASLIAQGFSGVNAAKTAVVWHARAAESANKGNCLIASDVIQHLAQEIL